MDYHLLNETIIDKVLRAVALINNPEIDPEVRQLNQEILFREVGNDIYAKIYDMNAFDFEIEHTRGLGMDDRYYGMAKVAAASVATGVLGLDQSIRTYLDSVVAQAQHDATRNALQSGNRVRVTREVRGEKTCKWCNGLAKTYEGAYDDIPSDIWLRHRDCDCGIITEGFNSRNGLLDNYVKPKDR